jgi:hypothetical protein
MNYVHAFRNFIVNGFTKPVLTDLVSQELYEAERKLLEAFTNLEWAQSNLEYQTNRVARLKQYITTNTNTQ